MDNESVSEGTVPEVVPQTKLPAGKDICVESIKTFDGTPSELDSFDSSVKQALTMLNIPCYYGGWVIGDPDSYYKHVPANAEGAISNYILGERLCAALTSKFTSTAQQWWEGYDASGDNPVPNCWKKNGDMRKPLPDGVGSTVEVSLYDLLRKQFNGDMDAIQAEIELKRFVWEPWKKDAMSVTVLRVHLQRLMKRARKTSTFDRIRAIRNCLPQHIREKILIANSEDKLWGKIQRIHITMEVDKLDGNICSSCAKHGHSSEVCPTAEADKVSKSTRPAKPDSEQQWRRKERSPFLH